MSRHQVWILVEGILDRSFYGQLCDNNRLLSNHTYQIALAKELPGSLADGKQNLLSLYRYLRGRKTLINTLSGEKTLVCFMLDKDIDDFERTKARSPHVVYTEYYSVENYVFRYGALSSALASAACLDIGGIRKEVGIDSITWTRRAAEKWRPFVKYCLLVRKLRIKNARNYGVRSSPMHSEAYSPCNKTKRDRLLINAMKDSGLSESIFTIALEQVERCVDKLYSQGKHDTIFNGKWYAKFLAEDARKVAGSRKYSHANIEERLIACLLVTLDFSDPWTGYFHRALNELIKML